MAGRPKVSDEQMLAFARRYALEHYGMLRGGSRWDRWAKENGAPTNSLYSARFPGGVKRVAEMIDAMYVNRNSVREGRRNMRKFVAWREGLEA